MENKFLERAGQVAWKLGFFVGTMNRYLASKEVQAGSLPSKKFKPEVLADPIVLKSSETSQTVFPGMYVYANGLISSEIIEGRQIKALSDMLQVILCMRFVSGKRNCHGQVMACKCRKFKIWPVAEKQPLRFWKQPESRKNQRKPRSGVMIMPKTAWNGVRLVYRQSLNKACCL